MDFKNIFRRKQSTAVEDLSAGTYTLSRHLGLRDITFLGIAAVIGAGIFGTIGQASAEGGPAVSLLFIFTAVACLFSALCYAEFASNSPLAGSAYTYAYIAFGEIIAWIIGWDLLMEYSIGNIAVAISWSDYFTGVLQVFHIHLPHYMTTDFLTAKADYVKISQALEAGSPLLKFSVKEIDNYYAWVQAPVVMGVHIIADMPALAINILITWLVYLGIRESKIASNIMVIIKLLVLSLVIVAGAIYLDPNNFADFAPNGVSGVLKGVSAVFFAYIGFDAISTTAEECKNPQKDLPMAMILALVICTILYVLVTLTLTGMVNYKELNVGDPLAYAFKQRFALATSASEKEILKTISIIVAISAVISMASVLLVFQLGQPRIWMSMSRDGLLPEIFGRIHKKYKTPHISTLITGLLVGLGTLFFNLKEVTDLTSIGTLFAFFIVCGGVLMKPKANTEHKGFKVPYYNARLVIPIAFLLILITHGYFSIDYIQQMLQEHSAAHLLMDSHATIIFYIFFFAMAVLSFVKKLSLIPVLGLVFNFYLIAQLGIENWLRFLIWLVVGLVIYFTYSYRKSKQGVRN